MENNLSLEVKAQEIHENAQFWHNRAEHNLYKFFLEVKKIRDNRYYRELGYSNFEDYCLNSWNIKRGTMDERIQIAETFSESDFNRYSGQLGHKKTLFLTTMSEPQREQTLNEGVPTEQGYKSYEKATQKEIAAYKRSSEEVERKAKEYEQKLKQRDEQNAQLQSQVEQARRSESITRKKLENEQNREPEVIEREVIKEVVPDEIQQQLEQFKQKFERESNNANELRNELQRYRNSFGDPNQAYEEKELTRLERESSINAHKISISIQNFIKENSVETYRLDTVIKANTKSKERLQENVALLKEFTTNLEAMLNGRIVVN